LSIVAAKGAVAILERASKRVLYASKISFHCASNSLCQTCML